MILSSIASASSFGRWKVLRPMIEPWAAAVADRANFGKDPLEVLGLAAREDDGAPAIEGRLHDMAKARGRGRDIDFLLSYTALAAASSRCWVGGLTLIMCSPSWAATCAA